MTPYRYTDEDASLGASLAKLAVGAAAGFLVGVVLAQKVGGLSGIAARVRERLTGGPDHDEPGRGSAEAYADDDIDTALEERVLEAFRNDPILSERAIDIGAIGEGIIELTGWVDTDEEYERATTITRGVPSVDTVVNRLVVGEEEMEMDENARRVESGDSSLTSGRWEGQQVGTGRRRQGRSDEMDRHEDPKADLEDRWLSEDEALRNAAEPTPVEPARARTRKAQRGGRTDGSAIAPTGVPKADHVVDPLDAPQSQRGD